MECRNANLIKIDKNGSKHFEGLVKCDRCGGDGMYKWGAMINGVPQYMGVCFKCAGAGWVDGKWIERTPEYQAKLDAKREEKWAAIQAKLDAERKAREEAERIERERKEREEAERKAKSVFFGEVGQKINVEATYVGSPYFERKCFAGYGTETCYIHTFKVGDSKLIWKTTSGIQIERDSKVMLSGTVKEHSEYREEKQTILTRCKIA